MIVCHKSLKQLGMTPEWESKYIHSYHKDKTMKWYFFFFNFKLYMGLYTKVFIISESLSPYHKISEL